MGDFPVFGGGFIQTATSGITAGQYGLTLRCTTANTKSSWQTLHTLTTYSADGLMVSLFSMTGANSYAVDIGIGAAGQERVILPDFFIDGPGASRTGLTGYFPANIPPSIRVAARAQCSAASQDIQVSSQLVSYGFASPSQYVFQSITGFGVRATLTTTTAATVVCSPSNGGQGTTSVKGQWYPIETSTPAPFNGMFLVVGNNNNTAMGTGLIKLDLGFGAAGSEQIMLLDYPLFFDATSDDVFPQAFFVPISLPQGNRFVARAQNSTKSAVTLKLAGYGFS